MTNSPTVSVLLSLQERRASTTGVQLIRFCGPRLASPTLHERRCAGRGMQGAPLVLFPIPIYHFPNLEAKAEAVRLRSEMPPRAGMDSAQVVPFFDPLEEEAWAVVEAEAVARRSLIFEPQTVSEFNPLSPGSHCPASMLQHQQGVPSPDGEDRPTVEHIEDISKEDQSTPPMDLLRNPMPTHPGL